MINALISDLKTPEGIYCIWMPEKCHVVDNMFDVFLEADKKTKTKKYSSLLYNMISITSPLRGCAYIA